MNKEWLMVKQFQKAFNHPVANTPTFMNTERAKKRFNWMEEELNEFLDAEEIVEQSDAMIDLIYFALGTLVEMGVQPDELFSIVHKANMSKLWEDGKPHYYPDGKTKKPSTWIDPHEKLKAEIQRQQTIITSSDYIPVIAENYLCLAATLEMVMKSINPSVDVDQYQLAEALGVVLPYDQPSVVSNVSYSDDPSQYGIHINIHQIREVVNRYLSVSCNYIHHTMFSELTFSNEIDNYLSRNCRLICGFSYGALYKKNDLTNVGHVCIINNIGESGLEIYDPGPKNPGYRKIDETDLLFSMKKGNGGIIILE